MFLNEHRDHCAIVPCIPHEPLDLRFASAETMFVSGFSEKNKPLEIPEPVIDHAHDLARPFFAVTLRMMMVMVVMLTSTAIESTLRWANASRISPKSAHPSRYLLDVPSKNREPAIGRRNLLDLPLEERKQ